MSPFFSREAAPERSQVEMRSSEVILREPLGAEREELYSVAPKNIRVRSTGRVFPRIRSFPA